MSDRRNFIRNVSAAALLGAVPGPLASASARLSSKAASPIPKLWGCLLHLGYNFWVGYSTPSPFRGYRPYLQLSEPLWKDAREEMAGRGLNMVAITLGDGVKYESHPEIAVNHAWSTARLREELQKFRDCGIEPFPVLNFSAAHDVWLGPYARMVSTEKYYQVCSDLIAEVAQLFDKPRFFHLGMDEEDAASQKYKDLIVVRQNDLWWHDFNFLVKKVEAQGCRAWVWSDYLWHHPDLFLKKMPRSVLQSNWYYGTDFDEKLTPVKAYTDLESYHYDQIPTAAFYNNSTDSIADTVRFCEKHITDGRLLGFLQTYWAPTTEVNRAHILKAIALAGEAKKKFDTSHAG